MDTTQLIKDDINFLEHPLWITNEKKNIKEYRLEKDTGSYEIKGTEGLPNRFDKVVLYYLVYKLLELTKLETVELYITRYEIAKQVFFNKKNIGKTEYTRVMKSLYKWAGVTIKFSGVFYENDSHTHRVFHILDDIIIDKTTNILYIRLNQQYVKQLQQTKFYKLINFDQYKLLTRPVAARLYELLVKTFKERDQWQIDIVKLAEKLTIEKRATAQNYYPSDVVALLKPAIAEINDNTDLKILFSYTKSTNRCSFELIENKSCKENNIKLKQNLISKPDKTEDRDTITALLVNCGMPYGKAQETVSRYHSDLIKQAIELLKNQTCTIRNPAAWLTKSLKYNWALKNK